MPQEGHHQAFSIT